MLIAVGLLLQAVALFFSVVFGFCVGRNHETESWVSLIFVGVAETCSLATLYSAWSVA